eukprot:gene12296-12085_t
MLDTIPDFHVSINSMREELGLAPITQQQITLMVGKGSENLIRAVLALDLAADQVEAKFAQAMDAYQRHYLRINGQFSSLYPDVLEGLSALKQQGLRLACVTNKPISFTTPLLAAKGLSSYFEVVYGGDSLARKKPDPLPLQTVCADFGLLPAQVVAIGDSSNDAQAARAAGCPAAWRTDMTELEFKSLATDGYNRIPLIAEAFADLETPLTLYLKLAQTQNAGKNTFLLESVVGGERFGRYSFIGLPATTVLRTFGHRTEIVKNGTVIETHEGNPLDFIESYQQRFKVALRPGMPRFCGGL